MERGKASAESVEQPEEHFQASFSAPPPPLPPWIELPLEITADILQRLGVVEILDSAQKVCTTWWNASKDPAIWRTINMSFESDNIVPTNYLQKEVMCRQVLDRSQGQVTDIKITNLKDQSTDLIRYIGERCSQLTCLSLDFISVEEAPIDCVSEALRKLVLLEKLQLDVNYFFERCCELIETAGKSCPAFRSFTLNKIYRESDNGDDIPLAVVEWMPQLRHLGLEQDSLTNDGLEAILDGCIYLESLHLCCCYNLRIEGELARRCSQQIRDLRIEHAYTSSEEGVLDYDDDYIFDYSDDDGDNYDPGRDLMAD